MTGASLVKHLLIVQQYLDLKKSKLAFKCEKLNFFLYFIGDFIKFFQNIVRQSQKNCKLHLQTTPNSWVRAKL